MFHPMRRSRQQLSEETTLDLLRTCTHGTLALAGDDGYPYAVPLSYVYHEGRLYFHGAKQGHKIDAMQHNDRASFCVVAQDLVVPEEYTTYYRSVIAFGRMRTVDDPQEIQTALMLLGRRYNPGATDEHVQAAIDRELAAVRVLALEIEHVTGKECIELVRKRNS